MAPWAHGPMGPGPWAHGPWAHGHFPTPNAIQRALGTSQRSTSTDGDPVKALGLISPPGRGRAGTGGGRISRIAGVTGLPENKKTAFTGL